MECTAALIQPHQVNHFLTKKHHCWAPFSGRHTREDNDGNETVLSAPKAGLCHTGRAAQESWSDCCAPALALMEDARISNYARQVTRDLQIHFLLLRTQLKRPVQRLFSSHKDCLKYASCIEVMISILVYT